MDILGITAKDLWEVSPLLGLMAVAIGYLSIELFLAKRKINELYASLLEEGRSTLLVLDKLKGILERIVSEAAERKSVTLKKISEEACAIKEYIDMRAKLTESRIRKTRSGSGEDDDQAE